MRWLASVLLVTAACGGSSSPGAPDGAPQAPDANPGGPDAAASAPDAGSFGDRPYTTVVPGGYDPATPTPLVLLLHGYGFNGAGQDAYFHMSELAEARTFLLAYAEGTVDQGGNQFWNATDACCDLYGTGVDDVAYLSWLLDDVAAHYNVDPARVYVVGHSNGAFMSYRLACDLSPRIAAIVSLAGATWADPAQCSPSSPVSILQVHGDADTVVSYTGGDLFGHAYPSAHETVGQWSGYDGCTGDLAPTGATMDLDGTLVGNETSVETYSGCPAGLDVQLWTIAGGSHIPNFTADWAPDLYDFLAAHPKR